MDGVTTIINEKKRYEHLPVRPETFAEFRRLKNTRSDDAFVLELLKSYKISTLKIGEQK